MSEPRSARAPMVAVHVTALPGEDEAELEELTALLRDELLDLDVAAVEPLDAEMIPDHAKGMAATIAGWLAVRLGPAAIKAVVGTLSAWATQHKRTVEVQLGDGVTLRLDGATPEQVDRVIEAWRERVHQAPRT